MSIIALKLAAIILIAGCSPARDLSAPSTIIVGHRGYYDEGASDPQYELYFGSFDESGVAQCFYSDEEGVVLHTCKIIEEKDDRLRIAVSSEENEGEDKYYFWPAKDGQTLKWFEEVLQYIDSNTEP